MTFDEENEPIDLPGASAFDDAVLYEDQVEPAYGILGFTLRELIIIGAWLVLFVISFFPTGVLGGAIWNSGISWVLTVAVPTAAVFLLVLRRFSPEGIRRVGSLGIDQFASVAAAIAAVAWAQILWAQVSATIQTGMSVIGWVPVVAQVASLTLVVATVLAPLIPALRDDFEGRMETLAHRNANPARPVIARPRPEAPHTGAEEAPHTGADVAQPGADSIDVAQPVTDSVDGNDSKQDAEADAAPTDAEARAAAELPADIPADLPADTPAGVERPADVQVPSEAALPIDTVVAPESTVGTDSTEATVATEITMVLDDATVSIPESEPAPPEPFWILAAGERDVHDEHGHPLFRIGPSAWALVIEDRGGAYVIRHDDGRIGYLHDITDITRG